MPYERNADLPEPVRNALPAAAQTIFRKAYNAALKTYNGDESKAAAVAWTAVKNAGYKKAASGTWTLSRTGVDAMPSHQIFLNALTPHQVTCTPTEDGKWLVKGLPLIRAGTWNDREYSADDLRGLAANFTRLRNDEGFTPGLWPQHNYDHEGKIVPQNASNALGFYSDLYFDEDTQVALGDVEVFDEETARNMERARLRYISGEFWRDEETGLSARGAAFVPDGAVKGIPWQMVINAADYSEMQLTNKPQTEGGKKPMSIVEKIRGLFIAAKDDDPEVLEQALADLKPDPPDDKPDPEPPEGTDGDDATEAESLSRMLGQKTAANAELQKQMDALQAEMATVTTNRQHDLADAKVDQWAAAGYVSPAARDWVMPLAQYALASDEKVTILSEDGGKTKHPMIDVLEEALKLTSPAVVTQGASGLIWLGSEDIDAEDEESMEQLGADMAATVNQPSPKTKDD